MPKTFRKVVLAETNDFKRHTSEQIKKWIEHWGGKYAKEIEAEVTHLLCSKTAWRICSSKVDEARKSRKIHIVNFDWLEDSLRKPPHRPLNEEEYSFEKALYKRVVKERKRQLQKARKSNQKRHEVQPDDSSRVQRSVSLTDGKHEARLPCDKDDQLTAIERCREPLVFDGSAIVPNMGTDLKLESHVVHFECQMKTAGYHLYTDSTGLTYFITLLRRDILRCIMEKYELKVSASLPAAFRTSIVPGTEHHAYQLLSTMYALFSRSPIQAFSCHRSARQTYRARMNMPNPWANMIQIYESDHKPHTYACVVHHSTKREENRSRPSVEMVELAPMGSTFEFTFAVFQKFFEKKCGVGWNNRDRNRNHNVRESDCLQDEDMSDAQTKVGSEATGGSQASSNCGASGTCRKLDRKTTCEVRAEINADQTRFKYVPNDKVTIKKLISVKMNQEVVQRGKK